MESNRRVQLMTPLSARTYYEAYDWSNNYTEEFEYWELIVQLFFAFPRFLVFL